HGLWPASQAKSVVNQMTTKMKVKKGDLVHMINGKDRGKQGRVVDARPAERRGSVENLDVVKAHTRPQAQRDSTRMGGRQVTCGGGRPHATRRPRSARARPQRRPRRSCSRTRSTR